MNREAAPVVQLAVKACRKHLDLNVEGEEEEEEEEEEETRRAKRWS